jgi:fatty acid desaturase
MTMSESTAFWATFWPTLGYVLAILPALLLFWGGMSVAWYVMTRQGRSREGERELRGRVAYLEGRLLPFDEARRQRGG